jgi:hypothetical protein
LVSLAPVAASVVVVVVVFFCRRFPYGALVSLSSVAAVTEAVERIEERTGAVTTEVNNKVWFTVTAPPVHIEGLHIERVSTSRGSPH